MSRGQVVIGIVSSEGASAGWDLSVTETDSLQDYF